MNGPPSRRLSDEAALAGGVARASVLGMPGHLAVVGPAVVRETSRLLAGAGPMITFFFVAAVAVVIFGILWVGVLAQDMNEAQYQSRRYRPRHRAPSIIPPESGSEVRQYDGPEEAK